MTTNENGRDTIPQEETEDASYSSELKKAGILVEALPYIKKFRGKRVVIKISGKVLDDPELEEKVIRDIVLLHFVGILPIIVHGGGKQIDEALKKWGKESSFINGRRVTDDQTMEVTQMVLVGLINKSLVSRISSLGAEAIGISGQDGRLILAKTLSEGGLDFGRVGKVEKINISLLERIYGSHIIPVIAPVAVDKDGRALNVNADEAATEIASMLCVEKLVFVSDVRGVLEKVDGKNRLLKTLSLADIKKLEEQKKISDGMIVKLQCAKKAIEEGVRSVQIISGIDPHSLLVEIFTDLGVGTKIVS